MNKIFIKAIISIIIINFLYSCAQVGTITGGDKDSIPPIVIKTYPIEYGINYEKNKVYISFNEFVQFKELESKFFMSPPPLKEKPEFKFRRKTLIVKFQNELKDSTTYRLAFGDAIVDYNESNPMPNYDFVFSTGQEIDTFAIQGKILDAQTLSPEEKVIVMIYENNEDSIPYLQRPDYIAKADTAGLFSISFIPKGIYKIFGLVDINDNYTFDLPNEKIAFLDTVIDTKIFIKEKKDSLKEGTIIHDKLTGEILDTLKQDSVVITKKFFFSPNNLELFTFEEDNKRQALRSFKRNKYYLCDFIFNRPIDDTLSIKPFNFNTEKNWYYKELSEKKDTLSYWITDTSIAHKDTLEFIVSYKTLDSLNNPTTKSDTIKQIFKFKKPGTANNKEEPKNRRRKNKNQKTEKKEDNTKLINYDLNKFAIHTNLKKNYDINKPINFISIHPIKQIDTSLIQLYQVIDTTLQEDLSQELKSQFRPRKDKMYLTFKRPLVNQPVLMPLNIKPQIHDWYKITANSQKDSFNIEFLDETIINKDTLITFVKYDNIYYLNKYQKFRDTAYLPVEKQKLIETKRITEDSLIIIFNKVPENEIKLEPEKLELEENWYQSTFNDNIMRIRFTDSTIIKKDTLVIMVSTDDVISKEQTEEFAEKSVTIFKRKTQNINSITRYKKDSIKICFEKPITNQFQLNYLDTSKNYTNWYSYNSNKTKDTIDIYINNNEIKKKDTISISVFYLNINQYGIKQENTKKYDLNILPLPINNKPQKTEDEKKADSSYNVALEFPLKYTLQKDSTLNHSYFIYHDWISENKYKFEIDSNALISVIDSTNKNYTKTFSIKKEDEYGTMILALQNIGNVEQYPLIPTDIEPFAVIDSSEILKDSLNNNNEIDEEKMKEENEVDMDTIIMKNFDYPKLNKGQFILQIMNEKEKIVRKYFILKDTILTVKHLEPGNYVLKIHYDINKNNKWDTGNYLKKKYPERMFMYRNEQVIKSLWETVVEWKF